MKTGNTSQPGMINTMIASMNGNESTEEISELIALAGLRFVEDADGINTGERLPDYCVGC
jgi:hypothetical protein